MKCPVCEKKGVESQVSFAPKRPQVLMRLNAFTHEGVYHIHDPNCHRKEGVCSEGHRLEERLYLQCPGDGCDYNKGCREIEVVEPKG